MILLYEAIMWKCHKCGKPVYFAERKQSLGYDWHPECLRCEECGKRLNPGQHAEHKGVPYCHVPCYGALFGPQLFGHGTRVESHKSFGQVKESPKVPNGAMLLRAQLEAKLKVFNQFYEGKSGEIRSREVNGRLVLEGSLRIHWGVQGVIHLKENDDQRTVVTVRKRNSYRLYSSPDQNSDDDTASFSRENSYSDISISSNSVTNFDSSLDVEKSDVTSTDSAADFSVENTSDSSPSTPSYHDIPKSITLPSKLDVKQMESDELDELLRVERKVEDSEKMYRTMPITLPSQSNSESSASQETTDDTQDVGTLKTSPIVNGYVAGYDESVTDDVNWISTNNQLNRSMSGPDCLMHVNAPKSPEFETSSITSNDLSTSSEFPEVVIRRAQKTGSTAIKRRPGRRLSRSKIKRRCSINGHFYDRETSFFTPPHGSQMSVWVSSLVNTQEVINLMLEKYKVDSDAHNFALFVVRDNGEQRRLRDDEYPLIVRVLLGPHEDITKLFLMDSHTTPEVSCEVAQFLNLSLAECRAILNQYYSQEEREEARVKDKYQEMKRRIKQRMEELKVRL